jgi:hypothetical protein
MEASIGDSSGGEGYHAGDSPNVEARSWREEGPRFKARRTLNCQHLT